MVRTVQIPKRLNFLISRSSLKQTANCFRTMSPKPGGRSKNSRSPRKHSAITPVSRLALEAKVGGTSPPIKYG